MKTVFVDSFYFFAILNKRDPAHVRARDWIGSFSGRLITSEWVFVEVADGMSSTRYRSLFGSIRNQFLTQRNRSIIPLDTGIYNAALNLYDSRPDKKWSLTDCTSFVIMEREKIADALTADRHFEQAGFVAVLQSP